MDRERFEHLVSAYGADIRRWPAEERAAAAAFAAQAGADVEALLAQERALDDALDAAAFPEKDFALLEARILKHTPQRTRGAGFDKRALLALAACAVFGVLLGYGGGRLAPAPSAMAAEEDEDYFTAAFEAPYDLGEGG